MYDKRKKWSDDKQRDGSDEESVRHEHDLRGEHEEVSSRDAV